MSTGTEIPDSLDLDEVPLPGKTPDEQTTPGPDVAPDGSIIRDTDDDATEQAPSVWVRIRNLHPI